ncbi:unnamed protein product [Durusdinium trenchii]|uniref:Transmembrane protein n=1 Tax=Durusdinium trenchii TaxID=1381693 RepID=A0ABP0L9L0_9DINO
MERKAPEALQAPVSVGDPGETDLQPPQLSLEDRAFLDEFGRRISVAAGSAALLGGIGFYGLARQMAFKRRGLWTTFGVTVCPFIAWYIVINKERERVMDLARKLQFDGGPGLPSPHTSQMSGDEALAKLFPPAPTLGAGAGAPAVPNRGFGWPLSQRCAAQ